MIATERELIAAVQYGRRDAQTIDEHAGAEPMSRRQIASPIDSIDA